MPLTRDIIEALHTEPMLREICGFPRREDIPSEATFSRAFAEFAKRNLGTLLHQNLVHNFIGDRIVGHLGRDSTAIEAREKPAKRPKKEPKVKNPVGHPKKGEIRPKKEETRIKRQVHQSVEQALAEIPKVCDIGKKQDSKGNTYSWQGYKAHIDTADGDLPVNVVTTSASVHDSQLAIPMMRQTSEYVISLYDLMDSAYDAKEIHQVSLALGHKPIIDSNPRRGEKVEFDPAGKRRYCQRSACERVNSRLKDEFGGRHLRVQGHSKVHLHIMFGIVALFCDQLFHVENW